MFEAEIDPAISRWHGGIATIVEDLGAEVWGAVWTLDTMDRASLDL